MRKSIHKTCNRHEATANGGHKTKNMGREEGGVEVRQGKNPRQGTTLHNNQMQDQHNSHKPARSTRHAGKPADIYIYTYYILYTLHIVHNAFVTPYDIASQDQVCQFPAVSFLAANA